MVGLSVFTGEYQWKDGFLSGSLYMWNPKLIELLTEVCSAAFYTNPLHPDVFPGINKMEAEVVRISCNLFRGGPESCGTVSTAQLSIVNLNTLVHDYFK